MRHHAVGRLAGAEFGPDACRDLRDEQGGQRADHRDVDLGQHRRSHVAVEQPVDGAPRQCRAVQHSDAARGLHRVGAELQHGPVPAAVAGRGVDPHLVAGARLERACELVVDDLAAIVRPAQINERVPERHPRRGALAVVFETPVAVPDVDHVEAARRRVDGDARSGYSVGQRDGRGWRRLRFRSVGAAGSAAASPASTPGQERGRQDARDDHRWYGRLRGGWLGRRPARHQRQHLDRAMATHAARLETVVSHRILRAPYTVSVPASWAVVAGLTTARQRGTRSARRGRGRRRRAGAPGGGRLPRHGERQPVAGIASPWRP